MKIFLTFPSRIIDRFHETVNISLEGIFFFFFFESNLYHFLYYFILVDGAPRVPADPR